MRSCRASARCDERCVEKRGERFIVISGTYDARLVIFAMKRGDNVTSTSSRRCVIRIKTSKTRFRIFLGFSALFAFLEAFSVNSTFARREAYSKHVEERVK